MPTVITSFAKKGGVGKTTLSLNLAGYLASKGKRVLLIDSDPQASLSQGLLGADVVETLQKTHTVASLFDDVVEPDAELIIHEVDNGERILENIWLAPASDLLQPYSHPKPLECGELRTVYRDFISEIGEHVDYVICDAPPDCSNLLSWNCLMAANYVLTPVNMETYSAQSVAGVNRKIDEAHRHGNPHLSSLGYIVNLRAKRVSLHDANEERFRSIYGAHVFSTVLYNWIAVAEAQAMRTHLFEYAPASAACLATQSFGNELVSRIKSSLRRAA